MGFDQIDEACIAGQRAENADFATPAGTAGINPLKIAKRNIYVPFHMPTTGIKVSGGIADGISAAFPGQVFQNAATGSIFLQACAPRGEIVPGAIGTLKILWESATNTGNVRFVAAMRTAIDNATTLELAITRNVIQAANASASALSIAKMEFPPAIFNNNQIWGLKLTRDPANTLDTLAADITVHAIWMEILGRC